MLNKLDSTTLLLVQAKICISPIFFIFISKKEEIKHRSRMAVILPEIIICQNKMFIEMNKIY
jgi:hypothetical protein